MTQIDFTILNFIQEHLMHPVLTVFLTFFTTTGNAGMIWILIGIFLLIPKKTRVIGIGYLLSLAIEHTIICGILKNIVCRPRPFVQNPLINLLISAPSGYSFPSGHSASSFCCATFLTYYNKKYGIPAIFLACLIAFSRLYFYVHFPSDVLTGLFIGVIVGSFGFHLTKTFEQKRKNSFLR